MHGSVEAYVAADAVVSTTLVLGTAQFGLRYGRRRESAILAAGAVEAILDASWRLGIRSFDSAEAYGPAAPRLARWLACSGRLGQSRIVTKVPARITADWTSVDAVCGRFDGARSLMLLSHGPLSSSGFRSLRARAHAIGVGAGMSVYTAREVEQAASDGAERVQAPVNVLDMRQLAAAHAREIPIDCRSVFLQGILLDDPDTAERRAPGAGPIAAAVQAAAAEAGLAAATALIAGVHQALRADDRILVGVDEPGQLPAVIAGFSADRARVDHFNHLIGPAREMALNTPGLLDPRSWS
jgi:aryl-alcohol dehydrogenase-like predicted oxidoreductase